MYLPYGIRKMDKNQEKDGQFNYTSHKLVNRKNNIELNGSFSDIFYNFHRRNLNTFATMRRFFFLLATLFFLFSGALSLSSQSYYVDRKGVLRDSGTKEEVSFFGANYTAPFAHAYRQLHRFGIDIKQTIDKDTYHLARIGATAYRIHVWDYEITDGEGNLIDNEHLDLFDYLLSKLEERNIHIVLTMMAGGGDSYPDPGEDLPGFQKGWSKGFATSDPDAAKKEENYIRNFVSHRNPYTGKQFKDDPMIVGFEINNEPANETPAAQTTAYVNRMIEAVRSTGCRKPVFYNVSHNFQNTQAFYDSKMDGGTFQWYPTGLVANHTRRGNHLPNVAEYHIPFEGIRNFDKKARIVYEFDAADQWASYLYPAIVRSFRQAGFQWVTFFAYDPIDIAQVNTEYQTHYLNLAYTPSKAISFKIASEAMKALPRGKSYGHYPESNVFGDFLVDYGRDLSVLNSGDKYYYSSTNDIAPKDPSALTSVAGVGSSPVVNYSGTGAYFLDKVSDGIWRLEVMPDPVLLSDPFAKASQYKDVATILWHSWPMEIDLPDLGKGYSYLQIDSGGQLQGRAESLSIEIQPGTYLLCRDGLSSGAVDTKMKLGNITLDEFVAPAPRQKQFQVIHNPQCVTATGRGLEISTDVVGPEDPDSVTVWSTALHRSSSSRWKRASAPTAKMERGVGYTYSVNIPAEKIGGQSFDYYITVWSKGQPLTFPGGVQGLPDDWDFYNGDKLWSTEVVRPGSPTLLYGDDFFGEAEVFNVHLGNVRMQHVSGAQPGTMAARIGSFQAREASVDAAEGEAFMRLFIKDIVKGRLEDLPKSDRLCIKIENHEGVDSLRAGFTTKDGFTWKADMPCNDGIVEIPLSSLKLVPTVLRPETYPAFLPDYFIPDPSLAPAFRIQDIETLEVGTTGKPSDTDWHIDISACWLQ